MNERIKELLEQATEQGAPQIGVDGWVNYTKFAELVIQECIKVADDSQYSCRTFPVSTTLKQHFGVE